MVGEVEDLGDEVEVDGFGEGEVTGEAEIDVKGVREAKGVAADGGEIEVST